MRTYQARNSRRTPISRNRGFTFLEMMAVLLIVGIVFSLVLSRLPKAGIFPEPEIPEFEGIVEKAAFESVSSGRTSILAVNLDEQTYAVFPADNAIFKNVPGDIAFTPIPESVSVTGVEVGGISLGSGTAVMCFFPDGTREYAIFSVSSVRDDNRWKVTLNPYSYYPEITGGGQ